MNVVKYCKYWDCLEKLVEDQLLEDVKCRLDKPSSGMFRQTILL